MRAPGILANLLMPSVLVAAALMVTFLARGWWFLSAWAACSLATSIAVLWFVWPKDAKPPKPAPLPRAWVRR